MITEKDIIKAYTRIRTIDNTIPDEVLNFIKDASIKQLRIGGVSEQLAKHEHRPMVNADWTYLKCECGKRFEPKG